jgi:hypothetical protein
MPRPLSFAVHGALIAIAQLRDETRPAGTPIGAVGVVAAGPLFN